MRVSLVGVSCVRTTTIGGILAGGGLATTSTSCTPEHILDRITFHDIDTRRIETHFADEERILQPKGDQGGHLLFEAVV